VCVWHLFSFNRLPCIITQFRGRCDQALNNFMVDTDIAII